MVEVLLFMIREAIFEIDKILYYDLIFFLRGKKCFKFYEKD